MDSMSFLSVTESKDVDSKDIFLCNVFLIQATFFFGEFPHLLPAFLCPPGQLVLEQCLWGLSL